MPTAYLQVRLSKQRHFLTNSDDVNLVITSNNAGNTNVLVLARNTRNPNNTLLTAIGYISQDSWRYFMYRYQNAPHPPGGFRPIGARVHPNDQRFGGPRSGENVNHPNIARARIWDLFPPHPALRGGFPQTVDDETITLRVDFD